MRNNARLANLSCIVLAWSKNPDANPQHSVMVGTSDPQVVQALTDLGWDEPKVLAAALQTYCRYAKIST
jgi:hypothetical protein